MKTYRGFIITPFARPDGFWRTRVAREDGRPIANYAGAASLHATIETKFDALSADEAVALTITEIDLGLIR